MTGSSKHTASPVDYEPVANALVGLRLSAAVVPVLVTAAARPASAPAACPVQWLQLGEMHAQQHRVLVAAAE